jgi:hypothetical protein
MSRFVDVGQTLLHNPKTKRRRIIEDDDDDDTAIARACDAAEEKQAREAIAEGNDEDGVYAAYIQSREREAQEIKADKEWHQDENNQVGEDYDNDSETEEEREVREKEAIEADAEMRAIDHHVDTHLVKEKHNAILGHADEKELAFVMECTGLSEAALRKYPIPKRLVRPGELKEFDNKVYEDDPLVPPNTPEPQLHEDWQYEYNKKEKEEETYNASINEINMRKREALLKKRPGMLALTSIRRGQQEETERDDVDEHGGVPVRPPPPLVTFNSQPSLIRRSPSLTRIDGNDDSCSSYPSPPPLSNTMPSFLNLQQQQFKTSASNTTNNNSNSKKWVAGDITQYVPSKDDIESVQDLSGEECKLPAVGAWKLVNTQFKPPATSTSKLDTYNFITCIHPITKQKELFYTLASDCLQSAPLRWLNPVLASEVYTRSYKGKTELCKKNIAQAISLNNTHTNGELLLAPYFYHINRVNAETKRANKEAAEKVAVAATKAKAKTTMATPARPGQGAGKKIPLPKKTEAVQKQLDFTSTAAAPPAATKKRKANGGNGVITGTERAKLRKMLHHSIERLVQNEGTEKSKRLTTEVHDIFFPSTLEPGDNEVIHLAKVANHIETTYTATDGGVACSVFSMICRVMALLNPLTLQLICGPSPRTQQKKKRKRKADAPAVVKKNSEKKKQKKKEEEEEEGGEGEGEESDSDEEAGSDEEGDGEEEGEEEEEEDEEEDEVDED